MAIPRIKYQQISINIASPGQQVPIDAETDKLYDTVTGINVLSTDDNAPFSTLQLDINGLEVFPANFEVIRLRFRQQAPFGYDYQTLNEPAGGSKIKGTYTDVSAGASYPYTVTLSFRLENKKNTDTGSID